MKKFFAFLGLLSIICTTAQAYTAGTGDFYRCESPSRIEFIISLNSWNNSATLPDNYPNILNILSRPGRVGLHLIKGSQPLTWSLQYGTGGAGVELGTCTEL